LRLVATAFRRLVLDAAATGHLLNVETSTAGPDVNGNELCAAEMASPEVEFNFLNPNLVVPVRKVPILCLRRGRSTRLSVPSAEERRQASDTRPPRERKTPRGTDGASRMPGRRLGLAKATTPKLKESVPC
jgi:hypothetical protein